MRLTFLFSDPHFKMQGLFLVADDMMDHVCPASCVENETGPLTPRTLIVTYSARSSMLVPGSGDGSCERYRLHRGRYILFTSEILSKRALVY